MIDNILTLLQLAQEQNIRSEYIDVALGKYKLPLSFKDIKNQIKLQK
tara:strand:- start:9776 stop:9916 length:141 start_codon:yes stop_codon:yes gene_type:complete